MKSEEATIICSGIAHRQFLSENSRDLVARLKKRLMSERLSDIEKGQVAKLKIELDKIKRMRMK